MQSLRELFLRFRAIFGRENKRKKLCRIDKNPAVAV